ncbi:MAG: TIGR02281 family clan AA aspartic protease, partial [Pseudomonas sp.]|nr:TIGR02281 family clan AA aspartic protease [Pseudomonas sp.]
MSQQAPGKGVGRIFMIVAWCAGLYLATQFFGRWEQRQQNPTTEVTSQQGEGYIEVKLLGNVQGHFVAS